MNEKDDIILEALKAIFPAAIGVTPLYWNIENSLEESLNYRSRTGGGFTIDTLRNRLDRLENVGLVETAREKGGYLRITDEGIQYLTGDLDVSSFDSDITED